MCILIFLDGVAHLSAGTCSLLHQNVQRRVGQWHCLLSIPLRGYARVVPVLRDVQGTAIVSGPWTNLRLQGGDAPSSIHKHVSAHSMAKHNLAPNGARWRVCNLPVSFFSKRCSPCRNALVCWLLSSLTLSLWWSSQGGGSKRRTARWFHCTIGVNATSAQGSSKHARAWVMLSQEWCLWRNQVL